MTGPEPDLWDDTDAELAPAVVEGGGEVAELVEFAERARDYARSSKAANTLRPVPASRGIELAPLVAGLEELAGEVGKLRALTEVAESTRSA